MNEIYVNINGDMTPKVNDYAYCYFFNIILYCKALSNMEMNLTELSINQMFFCHKLQCHILIITVSVMVQ